MSGTAKDLQERLGHIFNEPRWLEQALTHPSTLATDASRTSNQRLEFLGDAVLQLILSEELFRLYPEEREGVLSKRRAALVQGRILVELAEQMGLPDHLRVSSGERGANGHRRPAALEDAMEAVIGAVFLDAGFESTRKFVLRLYGDLPIRLEAVEHDENPKGRLQEAVQPNYGNSALRYEVSDVLGDPHDRWFAVRLYLADVPVGSGEGRSKKEAEEQAAREALTRRHTWPLPWGS